MFRHAPVALVMVLALLAAPGELAGVGLGAAPAEAQAGAMNADAQVFFERGNARFQRARRARGLRQQQLLEEALAAYVQSLRIVRSRNALFNAALVLEQLERPADAFAYYREYLRVPGLSDTERRDAERQLEGLRAEVAVVAVTSVPAGATVHVDRLDLAPVGTTPLEVALRPGPHRLVLSQEGYADGEAAVRAVRGERVEVRVAREATLSAVRRDAPEGGTRRGDGEVSGRSLTLPPGDHVAVWEGDDGARGEARFTLRVGEGPRDVSIVPAVGTLVVASQPAGEVSLDGAAVGAGSRLELRLPPGDHTVRIEAPGRTPLERRLRLDPGETLMLAATLGEGPTPARFRPAAHTLLALGLAAGAAGAGVGVVGLRERDDYEARCFPNGGAGCVAQRADVDRFADVADGLFVAGGALALTAIVLYVVGRKRPGTRGNASLAAAIAPGTAVATARFELGAPR